MQVLRLLAEPERHFGHQWSADAVEFGVCMTMITEELGVAQPTASKHLDILKQAGFITVRRHQKRSYCKRDEQAITNYLNWLQQELSLQSES
ncbi:transcriptional regulator, ArsR family [Jannaschia faecimaris]|uniref:Transcriptional regulator, ArsR family n=2 Tax=Jannaschia faecimaris TaxID=1244108 RepID=A0A1H3U257_9RHOB|nr:transcriptional regulator, ArsR family [Jannaschia faecimaris]